MVSEIQVESPVTPLTERPRPEIFKDSVFFPNTPKQDTTSTIDYFQAGPESRTRCLSVRLDCLPATSIVAPQDPRIQHLAVAGFPAIDEYAVRAGVRCHLHRIMPEPGLWEAVNGLPSIPLP